MEPALHSPPIPPRQKAPSAAIALVLVSFAIGGCAGNQAALGDPARGLKCVDDSHVCISQRKMVYNSYMAELLALLDQSTSRAA